MRVGTRSLPLPVVLALAAGMAGLVWLLLRVGLGPVLQSVGRLGWGGFGGIVVFHLGLITAMGQAWSLLGRREAGPGRFIFARYVRDSVAETLPLSQIGGFVVGARALVLGGASGLFAAASTLVDLTIEAFAKLPYTIVGLLLLVWQVPGRFAWIAGGVALVMVLGPALAAVWLQSGGAGWVERLARFVSRRMMPASFEGGSARGGKLRFDPGALQGEVARLYRRRRAVLGAFGIHTCAWLLSGFELWLTLRFMGQGVSVPAAIVIDSLLNGLRTFAFAVPGALGVQEAGYVALGGLFALSPDTALALSLVRRGRDLGYGIPGVLFWQAVEGRRWHRLARADRG